VLAGEGLSSPRAGGARQALSALLVAYRSCVAERTRLLNQLQSLHTSAPVALRERIGPGNGKQLAARLSRMRSRAAAPEAEQLVFTVLRDLARRTRELGNQAGAYERELKRLIESLDPTLLDEPGVGPISAAKLLASDPRRLKSEAAFARCNGTAPKPASSGQTIRHRLDRGGDRQANCALYTIALNRSVYDARTRAYLERRTSEGKTKREAMRALKRHLSRSLYKRLITVPLTP
jgi:transposase